LALAQLAAQPVALLQEPLVPAVTTLRFAPQMMVQIQAMAEPELASASNL
jgi:hypothetical protein